MKKNRQYEIINNQEDEDGYNLNPRNTINNEKLKSVLEIFSRNNGDKKAAIIKLQSRRKFAFASVAEKKKIINSQ